MSRDQMQDVFPIVFDFDKGEQPTSEKLTGLVKHTDGAFSRITQGIGDPWDYAGHSGTGGSYTLSLEGLAQSSIARVIGSSDWLSPLGGDWNENISSSVQVTLRADRNSWVLGYPLVSVSTPLREYSKSTNVTSLTWGADIVVTSDVSGALTNRVASADSVSSDGDFYVDFYKGTITSYMIPSSDILLTISNINMFGPGVPWGTHNVIPNWKQTVVCNVAKVSDAGGYSYYTLTLPVVYTQSRVENLASLTYGQHTLSDTTSGDSYWGVVAPGYSSQYRLPPAITLAGLSAGDTLPDGYCLLWDEYAGRVLPQVTFQYLDENRLTLQTPIDWLNVGDNYRVIVSGSSTAENVSYLMQMARNNEHVGLADNPTLSYTMPLSHDNLEDRYTTTIPASTSNIARWKFAESLYPTNCHPQYLHRGGYMSGEETGNSANAMRGDFVIAGHIDTGFVLGPSTSMVNAHKTYAISFGGGHTHTLSTSNNMYLRLEGLEDSLGYNPWSSGRAKRIPFGLYDTGAQSHGVPTDTNALGGLSLYPQYGIPLYLRGQYTSTSSDEKDNGAILGFDLGQRMEANYVRLLTGIRDGLEDKQHMPANVGQSATGILSLTPGLSSLTGFKRIAADQVREFRFRGVPYVENATNTSDALGGSSIRATPISEFQHHFTSPAILGADFLNVYSNAIFFSDTGDGKVTSFTTLGNAWLNSGTSTSTPSGFYYIPQGVLSEPYLSLWCRDTSYGTSTQPFSVGTRHGIWYDDDSGPIVFQSGSTSAIRVFALAINTLTGIRNLLHGYGSSNTGTSIYSDVNDIRVNSGGSVSFSSGNVCNTTINILGGGSVSTGHSGVRITDSVHIAGGGSIALGNSASDSYDNNVIINAGNTFSKTTSLSDTLYLVADGDIRLVTANGGSQSVSVNTQDFASWTFGTTAISSVSTMDIASIGDLQLLCIGPGNALKLGTNTLSVGTQLGTPYAYTEIAGGPLSITGTGGATYGVITAHYDIEIVQNSPSSDVFIRSQAAFSDPTPASIGAKGSVIITASKSSTAGSIQLLTVDTGAGTGPGDIAIEAGEDAIIVGNTSAILYGGSVGITSKSGDISITPGGNLEIAGLPSASATPLHYNPATDIVSYWASSIRYKEDIEDMKDVSWLYNLRPRTFKYKKQNEDRVNFGLIAEEVVDVIPDLVGFDFDGDPEYVRYHDLISVLLLEIQNHKKEIDQLKIQITGK